MSREARESTPLMQQYRGIEARHRDAILMFRMGDGAVAMGDLVLAEDELNPVLSRLQQGGVEQTAIRHHITRESPRVLYVHIHGHGDPVKTAETIREGDFEVPPSMGLGTAINFQPTGGGKAAITGDFVMVAGEVNPVIRALRESGIEVTSLHNHLLTDEPRLFFMHFWANDDALELARGPRTALDQTNSRRPAQ